MEHVQISRQNPLPPPASTSYAEATALSPAQLQANTVRRPASRMTQAVIVLALVNAAIMLLRFTEQCVLARALGAGQRLDAYFLGQVVVLLGAQAAVAVTTAAVPVLADFAAHERKTLVRQLLAAIAPSVLLATAIAALLSGPIVWALAGNFDSDNRLLARAILLWLLPATAACLFAGLLRAYWFAERQFVIPGTGQLFMPLCTCAGAAMVAFAGWNLRLAAAVANLGALVLIIVLYRPLRKRAVASAGAISLWHSKQVRHRFGKALLPVTVALALLPAMIAVSRCFASALLPGSVTAVTLAASLASIPGQFAAASVGMVLLPQTALFKAAGRMRDAAIGVERALCSTAFVALPCAIVLGLWPHQIVQMVFQRGAFDRAAVGLTASALTGFSVGVPLLAALQVLAFALFAVLGTRQVALAAVFTLLINLLLNRLLLRFGAIGIAVAFSLACWINGAMLLRLLDRSLRELRTGRILLRHLRILAISVLAGTLGKICCSYLAATSAHPDVAFLVSLAVVATVYVGASRLVSSPEMEEVLASLGLGFSRRASREALTAAD